MLERAIENWLTNAGEKQYQSAFCQVLMQQGHRVLRVSKHRSTEEGKDVVSIDRKGQCNAYQLKAGPINVDAWRAIHGELIDLVSIPVKHPSVPRSAGHKAWLVTNGRLADEVHQRIEDLNRDHQERGLGYAFLDVVERDGLLRDFAQAQRRFVPVEPDALQRLLTIFLADGAGQLDKTLLYRVLGEAFFDSPDLSPARATNAVTASVVMLSYLLDPFQRAANHFAVFEAWMILSGLIEGFALRTKIRSRVLNTTRAILLDEVLRALEALKEEALSRSNYLEGDIRGDGGLVYRARATLALGASAALEVTKHSAESGYQVDPRLADRLERDWPVLWFWGDGSFPLHFAAIRCLELAGRQGTALQLLTADLKAVVKSSTDGPGLPSVYYGVEPLLVYKAGLAPLERGAKEEDFVGQSWSLHNLVLMCARRAMREVLESEWARISAVHLNWFEPSPGGFWAWRPEEGSNESRMFPAGQSWQELRKLACEPVRPGPILKAAADRVLLYLLVRPERALHTIVAALDGRLERQPRGRKKSVKEDASTPREADS